jgi:glycosyltransferase involved in cell wall biosynthesis
VEIGEKLGLSDVFHIPLGIDHSLYQVLRPIAQRKPQVAMMFSEVPFKRAEDGIKALEIVKTQYPDLRAVLFGIGSRSSSIPAWMEYVQDPPQGHLVSEIFNTSRIVLSSSLSEGFGLPPAEGAACGCAIVSTDSGGVRDFVIHGETGLLSAPQDPQALAHNVSFLLAHDDVRIRLAEAARSFVRRFDWEHSTDSMEEFLNWAKDTEPLPRYFAESPEISVPRTGGQLNATGEL